VRRDSARGVSLCDACVQAPRVGRGRPRLIERPGRYIIKMEYKTAVWSAPEDRTEEI
jgi:hypothetical protein